VSVYTTHLKYSLGPSGNTAVDVKLRLVVPSHFVFVLPNVYLVPPPEAYNLIAEYESIVIGPVGIAVHVTIIFIGTPDVFVNVSVDQLALLPKLFSGAVSSCTIYSAAADVCWSVECLLNIYPLLVYNGAGMLT
jgi:hypothetical protein